MATLVCERNVETIQLYMYSEGICLTVWHSLCVTQIIRYNALVDLRIEWGRSIVWLPHTLWLPTFTARVWELVGVFRWHVVQRLKQNLCCCSVNARLVWMLMAFLHCMCLKLWVRTEQLVDCYAVWVRGFSHLRPIAKLHLRTISTMVQPADRKSLLHGRYLFLRIWSIFCFSWLSVCRHSAGLKRAYNVCTCSCIALPAL